MLLILVLPGLNALARGSDGASPLFRGTALLVVVLLWGGTLSRKLPVWLRLGLGWWWVVCVLGVILVASLHGMPGGRLPDRIGWRRRAGRQVGCPVGRVDVSV